MTKIENYAEPNLILLCDLKRGGKLSDVMPEGARNLAEKLYRRNRDNFSEVVGSLELAYRRGYHAGQIDAGVDTEEMEPSHDNQ